ncbi:MAG: hypothetical protein OXC40_05465 [Proteobacteria bacterium]|nr:hypothetical protein [Pseudomonadota bacterium]
MQWHILTTSFPPYRGGLGFHSLHLAECLAQKGDQVTIWSAFDPDKKLAIPKYVDSDRNKRVQYHHVAKEWNRQSLAYVAEQILKEKSHVVIQYRPKAFSVASVRELISFSRSFKRMTRSNNSTAYVYVNVIIHRAIEHIPRNLDHPEQKRRKSTKGKNHSVSWQLIWMMAHDMIWQPIIQLLNLSGLVYSSQRVLVTSSRLARRLRVITLRTSIHTMPVSSPITHKATPAQVANLRQAFLGDRALIIGTYSSFKEPEVLKILAHVMVYLLKKNTNWLWLGFGRFAEPFFKFLASQHPDISDRMQNSGELDHRAISAHISVCDIMFQPYYHGVSTQRASAMTILDHALPLVTSLGKYTEKIWQTTGCAQLIKWNAPHSYISSLGVLGHNPNMRKNIGFVGKETYDQHFAWQRNIDVFTLTDQD